MAQTFTDKNVMVSNWPYAIPLKDSQEVERLLQQYSDRRTISNDSMINLMQYIEQQCARIGYDYGRSKAKAGLGLAYLRSGAYHKAIAALLKAEELCYLDPRSYKFLPSVYNNLGTASESLGYMQQATHYYLKSLEAIKKYPTPSIDAKSIYNNLASVVPDKKVAMQYLDKTYSLAEKENDTRAMGYALQNKSVLYERMQDSISAYRVINESYLIALEYKDTFLQYMAHIRWVYNYLNRKEPSIAIKHLQKARELENNVGLKLFDKNAHLILAGDVAYHLNDYKQAIRILSQALQIAKRHGLKDQEAMIYSSLSLVYRDANQLKKAFEYQNKYIWYKDSIMNEKIAQGVNMLEVQFRTSEKDKLLQTHKIEATKRNSMLLAVSLCTILLIILFIAFYRSARNKQKLLKKEQEIATIKAQVAGEEAERKRISEELHDGVMVRFSCVKMNLASAIAEIPEQHTLKLKEAIHQLDDATAELRQSAHNLMPDLLLKEGLDGALKYFCEYLQRYAHVCYLQNGMLPAISAQHQLALFRIVQELVQNALKHAKAEQIIVQRDYLNDRLYITVEDNGVGFDPAKTGEHQGMGLHNIKARILSLGGTIAIESDKESGTSISIEIDRQSLES